MKVTSKKPQRWGFPVTNNDLVKGSLAYDSFVQIDAIHSLEKSIIISVIGMLRPDKMNDIHKQVFDLLTPDSPAYG